MRVDDMATDDGELLDGLGREALGACAGERPKLGELLIAAGEISQSELAEALQRKHRTGRRIGEELVAAGIVPADRLARTLRLQRRIILAALFTALMGQASAAEVRTYLSVSATVVDTVGLRPLYQAQELVVTANDVQRGYVEVPAGSRFEIRNKGACIFEFQGIAAVFRAVKVTAPGGAAEFGPGGGTMFQKSAGEATASVSVNYRFELAAGIAPGTYRWPLALTVLPM